MTIQTAATLKGYFNTGDVPTESNFSDLIDSTALHASTGGLAPLVITSASQAIVFDASALDAGSRNWNIGFNSAVNTGDAGRRDVHFAWGYNVDAGWGMEDNTEHSLYYVIEDYYAPLGSNAVTEAYLQYFSPGGAQFRPYYCTVDLVTDKVVWDFYTDTWYVQLPGGGNLLLEVIGGATTASSKFYVDCPSAIRGWTVVGGGASDTARSELHISKPGGGATLTTDWEYSMNHYEGTWGANATRTWFRRTWAAGPGGYVYFGYTGNDTSANFPALMLSQNYGLVVGKGTDAANALTTEWARINTAGNLLIGTTTDGMTASGSLAVAKDFAHRGANVGFFNKAPAAQQTKAGHNNWAAISDVVSALVNLGLFDTV